MPAINCVSCGKIERLPTKKWSLILSGEPYVCSPKCLVDWITQTRYVDTSKWPTLLHKDGDSFRSGFELRVRNFLKTAKVGPVLYEAVVFPVGKGFYMPDFYIIQHDCFIEAKGVWRLGQKKKFRLFCEQYPEISIMIIPWVLQDQFK